MIRFARWLWAPVEWPRVIVYTLWLSIVLHTIGWFV